ncbi:MAG: N-6 DNA methylase [Prevotella sp.]|jgi:Alw26I/Eco31I/Esp3I family type II restriction m6 adenine DNA methyltransferase|nr:N-6 DNA methylase [Prevotella sp.]
MNYTKEDFKSLFQSKFDYAKWFTMLKDFFKADELRTQAESISDPADCDKGSYIGAINTEDSYRIGLFYYEIGNSNVARKKVGLRNLVKTFINPNWGQFDAALAVFSDGNQWRLSLISDIKGEATAAKRFTFVFGEKDNLYRTAIERFALIRSEGATFEVLKKAFSVEALTEEFFNLYKDHYERFCDFIYQNADNKDYFGPEFAEWNSHEETQKHIRDYVKNLMGRIVFLQFLQKKGWMGVPADRNDWMGGDAYFMQHLYDYASEEQKEDFLDKVLEPLFFNCLNTLRPNDVFETNIKGIGAVKVPYLNGELFEQKEVDKAKSRFPQKYFYDLLNLFLQYNFTIDENDPNDAEIGVDPEMLGKIFENLLEDNKDKGAFYTPKEIVSYMCKESLIAYLCTHAAAKHEEAIKVLVNNHQLTDKLQEDVKACQRINKYLQDVKVCDPAIGSGAFPMGVMNEIFACRKVLHENIEEDVDEETHAQIKRDIIQNNIYGVDIEQGAVDIARLRFWLALVVDSVQPEPLPNLDYKIMQGNSLVESYKGLDLSNLLHSDDLFVATKAQELPKLLRGYYREMDNDAKRKLRQQIDFTIKQCIYLAGIQNTIDIPNSDFFLWHTYFQEVFKEGGFDIVIGNPPYNEMRDLTEEQQSLYKRSIFYKYAQGGRINMFQFFYPLALHLIKKHGICSFITQNSILAEESAYQNRKLIFDNCKILRVDSFPERDNVKLRVFESAKMSVGILLLEKVINDNTRFCVHIWKDKYMNQGQLLNIYKGDIKSIFPDELIIPICNDINWSILIKMKMLSEYSIQAQAGEIDMTKYKTNFSENSSGKQRVITGAQVLRYYLTDFPSQGKVLYLNFNEVKLSESRIKDYMNERIAMQRITGVDSKIRIIATMIPSFVFCANSTNYISSNKNDVNLYYLLGIINSKLLNFYFKQTSTNTNVTGKEIAKFPIILSNLILKERIEQLSEAILTRKESSSDTNSYEHNIDVLVYKLYNLSFNEVKIVDPETPITKEEYNNPTIN